MSTLPKPPALLANRIKCSETLAEQTQPPVKWREKRAVLKYMSTLMEYLLVIWLHSWQMGCWLNIKVFRVKIKIHVQSWGLKEIEVWLRKLVFRPLLAYCIFESFNTNLILSNRMSSHSNKLHFLKARSCPKIHYLCKLYYIPYRLVWKGFIPKLAI